MKIDRVTGLDRAVLERTKNDERPASARRDEAPHDRVTLSSDAAVAVSRPPVPAVPAAPPPPASEPAAGVIVQVVMGDRSKLMVNDHAPDAGGRSAVVVMGEGSKLMVNDHASDAGGGSALIVMGAGSKLMVNDHAPDAGGGSAVVVMGEGSKLMVNDHASDAGGGTALIVMGAGSKLMVNDHAAQPPATHAASSRLDPIDPIPSAPGARDVSTELDLTGLVLDTKKGAEPRRASAREPQPDKDLRDPRFDILQRLVRSLDGPPRKKP